MTELMSDEKFKLKVWYSGRVQGVGFRYKASQVAKGYDVVGEVENLDDGRVLLTALGDEAEVKEFESKISELMADFIRQKDSEESRVSGTEFSRFSIRL